MENYDNIITEIAELIIANKGTLEYPVLIDACKKLGGTKESAKILLVATMIAKHIPIFEKGQRLERASKACPRSAFVFAYTRIDEDNFIKYSATNDKIPTFKRHDPNDDDKFHAGTGSRLADFEATTNPRIIADMKATPIKSYTVSGYHDANHIICPCITNYNGYAIYLIKDGKLDLSSEVLVPGFVGVDRDYPVLAETAAAEYKELFKNIDQTVADIDTKLAANWFIWPR